MTRLAPLICAAMLAAGAAVAPPASAEDGARTVEVELHEDGQLVATPSVRVTLGRPAAVTMGGYSLRFRMEQASGGDYVIRSSLYRSEGGWTRLAAPTLTVAEGEQARARFAAADGSDLSLAVLVR